MILLAVLVFTALLCALPVAVVGGCCAGAGRLVLRIRRRLRAVAPLPDDWWEQFERDLHAYSDARPGL